MSNTIPVLITGAGPTGLSMAVELNRHGIAFRIIDKQTKPVPTSNALVAQTRTLEVWEDQGLLSDALTRGNILRGFNFYAKNKNIIHLDLNILNSDYPFVLGIAQHQTEVMLLDYLKNQGISVERETELIDFSEEKNQVKTTLRHPNGETEVLQADWVIACDGARSLLRTRCHIPFLGKELSQHFVLADLKIKSELPSNQVYAFMSDNGPLLLIQFDQNYSRLIAEVTHDPELSAAKSVTDEQLKRLVRERSPFKLELEKPVWTSGFWIHERIVSSYRHNNIFFAGDTAHIHSPAGGQGMNTGIQDVYNLAWKLALVINKKAPSTLLDSYHIEREQVGKSVLKKTTLLTWMISLHHPVLSFIRNWILSHVMRFEKIRKKIAEDMTQLAIHYKNSSVIEDHLKTCLGPPPGMRML
ncbi:MAG TPA: FAD-dependent monooxygenase, partial [Gammaproteobacteria bacterium]|nr:FAD-dependent monooxygenase [Gammaproteobacteria bacterium]